MPYQSASELPDNVRDVLPSHAQSIYRAAFNNAWEEYAEPSSRREGDSRDEVAHKVAWNAVKQQYEKRNGKWQKKA